MKKMIKKVVRNSVFCVVGLICATYLLNCYVAKLFKKLPRLVKVGVVYSMIILSVMTILNYNKTKTEIKIVEKEKVVVVAFEEEKVVEEKQEETKITFENENETNIYNTAIENGLTHEQALLTISISRHETGNWKSNAFVNKHNFGGIMTNKATQIKSYSSYQEGLNDFIRILKSYYFDLGLTTVEEIGAKYCPVGAKNDPNGKNKYWVGSVSSFYQNYLKNF